MRMRPIGVGGLLLALTGMMACGSARPSKYYHLEVPVAPGNSGASNSSANVYPVGLLIGRFTAPHLYQEDRIVYRIGTAQMGTYEYHRWAEPPTEMLEAMLLRMLRASGRYRTIQTLRSNARGEYIVRGRLYNFEEVSSGQLAARVKFEIELFEIKTGTTVWTKFYSQDEPVSGREVPDVVEALNRNALRGLEQVAAGLDQYFASHPPE